MLFQKSFSKTKTYFIDRYHLLFRGAAENHLRIQQALQNPDGTYQVTLKFDSYTELKKYQKKLRRITVSLSSAMAMVLIAVIVAPYVYNPSRSSASNYAWTQTGWDALANASATIEHPSAGQTTYAFKDGGISTTSGNEVTLLATVGSKTQTNNGTTVTGFNLSGADFDSAKTVVSGTDTAAVVQLGTMTQGATLTQTNETANTPDPITYPTGGFNNSAAPLKTNTEVVGTDVNASVKLLLAAPTQVTKWWGAGGNSGTAPGAYSWTVPAGVASATIEIAGGGGGGGGDYNDECGATNGGGGLLRRGNPTIGFAGKTFNIVVGQGGSGGGYTFGVGTPSLGVGGTGNPAGANGVTNYGGGGGGTSAYTSDATIRIGASGGNGGSGGNEYGTNNHSTASGGINTTLTGFTQTFSGAASNGGLADNTCYDSGFAGGTGWVKITYQLPDAYQSSGTYISHLNGGATARAWNTFAWDTTPDGDGTITMKVKSTATEVAPTNFTVDGTAGGTACSGVTSGASIATNTCVNNTHQYLWYQATFSNTTDTSDSPTLNSVTTTTTTVFQSAGTYTSGIINTGQKNINASLAWNEDLTGAGTNPMKFQISSSANGTDWTSFFGPDGAAHSDCLQPTYCYATKAGQPLHAIHNGAQYFKYKAFLSTTNIANTPKLNDVNLSYVSFPTTAQKLISSPYNTTDKFTALESILGNRPAGDSSKGNVEFQIRTAPSNALGTGPDWTSAAASGWCGQSGCNATKNATANANFASGANYSSSGATLNTLQLDHSGNQWVQYAAFLSTPSATDGSVSPTLDEVITNFAYNNPPTVTLTPNQPSQITKAVDDINKGKVKVEYAMTDTDTDQTTAQTRLFYQPGAITISSATSEIGTENITIAHDAGITIPSTGTILVDQELIAYSGKTDNGLLTALSGVQRAQVFTTGNYINAAKIHAVGAKVFFPLEHATGQINGLYNVGTNYSTMFDPKAETNFGSLDGTKWTKFIVALAANDGYALDGNKTGVAVSSEFTVDLEKPIIKSITSETTDGRYGVATGNDINVTINFADALGNPKNVTSMGDITIVLETGDNDYDCLVSQIVTPASSATCSYQVRAGDATSDLNAISPISGTIADQFGNSLASTTIPNGQNIADLKDIIIDTAAPVISEAAPAPDAFINSITSANGGSDASFTLNEKLIAGSYLKITATAGIDLNNEYLCTLQGAALNLGAHNNFEIKQATDNCAEVQTALQDGSKYSMTMHAIDEAGNVSDILAGNITFDATNPTASITSPSNNAFINNITDASDVSYSLEEALQTGSYLKFTRTGGAADSSSPRTCNLTGTELTAGDHNNVDLNAK